MTRFTAPMGHRISWTFFLVEEVKPVCASEGSMTPPLCLPYIRQMRES